MDRRIQKTEKYDQGDIGLQRTDTLSLCENSKSKKEKPGRRQKTKPTKIIDADQIKLTISHFFPGNLLNQWIAEIHDPRVEDMCTYKCGHLIWLGILMFLFRLKSRCQLNQERQTEVFLKNLVDLSNTYEKQVASPDSMNYLLEQLDPLEIETVKVKMVKQLIKDKRLDAFRLNGEFRIAIDGTGVFSSSNQHCECCLKTTHSSGAATWSHKMLEAKLVAENGFAMSVCSEAIENENGIYDKQDCELKAFYRMEQRLKTYFPRTPICLLLDGIYACDEVFKICERNNWSYITVLKPGRIPTLFQKALKKQKLHPQNHLELKINKDIEQKLSWVYNLEHKSHALHVIFCEETKITKGKSVTTYWSWVTNIRPNAKNISELANKGGRQRWKIENQGFKEQKRHEFELEHMYSEKTHAWKSYYQLLQIAHIITQLIIYGDLCVKLQKYNSKNQNSPVLSFRKYYQSIRNFVRRLAESFRNSIFSELTYSLTGKIQIRFDSG